MPYTDEVLRVIVKVTDSDKPCVAAQRSPGLLVLVVGSATTAEDGPHLVRQVLNVEECDAVRRAYGAPLCADDVELKAWIEGGYTGPTPIDAIVHVRVPVG